MKANPELILTHENDRFDKKEASLKVTVLEAKHICDEFSLTVDVNSISLLEGGFQNANFLVKTASKHMVLRIYTDGAEHAKRELNALELARNAGVNSPQVIATYFDDTTSAAVFTYIEGQLLSEFIAKSDTSSVFEKCGQELAKIHNVKFEQAGLLSTAGKQIKVPFKNYSSEAKKFLESFLNGLAGERLGNDLTSKIKKLVSLHWHLVESTYSSPRLIHCDFNPKNIMVTNQNIFILDWEFAMAGHSLCDLANFLRFETDYSQPMVESFLAGYQKQQKLLPNWREAAYLLDLVSLCFFLNRKTEQPKTFQTAKAAIQNTIDKFF